MTRHNRLIGGVLAVALALGASFLPAAAQSGSEAVVCVGSETRTHSRGKPDPKGLHGRHGKSCTESA